jgi:transposase, IS30 family
MKYKQLTPEQRYQIYAYIQNDWTQTRMALELCVHKATIRRELRRNKSQRGYRPKKAIELAQGRRHGKSKARISRATWEFIEAAIRQQWSPEQISGRLRHEGKPTVSHTR